MNRHLLREWSRRVHADDTIICLGDVAHPDGWRDRRLVLDVRNCPSERILVLGNDDRDTEALHDAGFTEQHVAALCATDPPLALSHLPLRRVPPTAVNVHGHLHGGEAPTRRHINVSVEQTDYAPVGLTWCSISPGGTTRDRAPGVIIDAMRRRAAGRPQGPGGSPPL